MSDYVEARYAVLVIRQAHTSKDWVALDLMSKLLGDLCPHIMPDGPDGDSRIEALSAIRALALSFDHYVWPPTDHWENAHQAVQRWCDEATA